MKNYPTPNSLPHLLSGFAPSPPKALQYQNTFQFPPRAIGISPRHLQPELTGQFASRRNQTTPRNSIPPTTSPTMDFSSQGRACFTCEFAVAVSSLASVCPAALSAIAATHTHPHLREGGA